MRIRKKFLKLTRSTYPHGTESMLKGFLPPGFQTDEFGNYFIDIGDSTTMFTCHLDTVSFKQEKVNHVIEANFIKTDGKTILGADDKAGMTVMLYMIEKKVPGLYYFFVGEEVGCVGSGKLAETWETSAFYDRIKKVVSFDRRGTTSIITHQLSTRCCSEEFATELANRFKSTSSKLNMTPDDTGVFTDSAKFIFLVPECTNISVGYYNEHTLRESQDIGFLQRLCRAVCEIDWETLPISRDPDLESDDFFDYDDDDDDDDFDFDEEYTTSYFSYFKSGDKTKKLFISKKIIEKEKVFLTEWLKNQGWSDISQLHWNGNSLNIQTPNSTNMEFIGNRYDLIEFLPELGSVPSKFLKEKIEVPDQINF